MTVFAGGGVHGVVDQLSRTPESLARSLRRCLRSVGHPKLVLGFDACLVVSPDHGRVFREAGWSRARLREELAELLTLAGDELIRGAGGIDEGVPDASPGPALPKFRDGGLLLAYAGGGAGLFSAIIDGWVGGPGVASRSPGRWCRDRPCSTRPRELAPADAQPAGPAAARSTG